MGREVSRNRIGEGKNNFTLINNWVENILSLALILLMTIIVLSTFMQVVFRYALSTPLIWPEEIARLSYVWVSFIGMSILIRRGTLLGVDTLLQMVNDRLKNVLFVFSSLVLISVLVLFAYLGFEMLSRIEGQSMAATGLSTQWMYIIVPISSIFGLLFAIEVIFTKIIFNTRR